MLPHDFVCDAPTRRPLLTYAQVSKRLAIPVGTLRWLVHVGRIPVIRLGPRMPRFDPDLVDAIASGLVRLS